MTVVQEGSVLYLDGPARVEDAETLTALLQRTRRPTVDLTRSQGLHAAVVQAILAFEVPLIGNPADPFLRDLLMPALASERQSIQRKV